MQLKYYGFSVLAHGLLFGAVLLFLPVAQLQERPPILISGVELVPESGPQAEEVPVTLPSAEETAAIAQEILADTAEALPAAGSSGAPAPSAGRQSAAPASRDMRSEPAAGAAGAGPAAAAGPSGTGSGSAPASGPERSGEGKSSSGEGSGGTAAAVPGGNGTETQSVTVTNPSIAYAPEPEYPAEARRDHLEGRAVVSVLVGEDGSVESCSIEQSTGYASLDQAALAAVSHWRFQPARRGEQAIEKWVLLPVSFSLY